MRQGTRWQEALGMSKRIRRRTMGKKGAPPKSCKARARQSGRERRADQDEKRQPYQKMIAPSLHRRKPLLMAPTNGAARSGNLDVDFCRAVAAAIFNDPKKVKF